MSIGCVAIAGRPQDVVSSSGALWGHQTAETARGREWCIRYRITRLRNSVLSIANAPTGESSVLLCSPVRSVSTSGTVEIEARLLATEIGLVTKCRKVIVHIATSADGYIARSDGDLEWLTSRPAPKGFYGMNAFMRSVGTKLLGRKTYEVSLRMGAKFDSQSRSIVFSRHPPPDAPSGVEFV